MMLQQMTSSEFGEAMAYASIDPCGEYRNELRHGQQMAMTANINRDSSKRSEPYSPADFMNFIERPETPEPTQEENFARIDKEAFGL